MIKLMILGDVHLGKSLSLGKPNLGSLNTRILDQLDLLNFTLEQAMHHQVDHLVITGDIFDDPKPQTYLVTLFIRWLQQCSTNNITVHLIAGNHDLLRSGNFTYSPLDIVAESEIPNIHIYKEIDTINLDGVSLTLVPFRDRRSFNTSINSEAVATLQQMIDYEAMLSTESTKILVGHLAIEGSLPIGDELDDLTNELFCPLEMFDKFNYVWMGHIHKPQVMKKDSNFIAHIGSMDISDYGETNHKKSLILFENNAFEMIKLPTRTLVKIQILVPAETKDTTKFVIQALEKQKNLVDALVKIEIILSTNTLLSPNKKEIEDFLYSMKVFHVSKFSESRKIIFVKKHEVTEKLDSNTTETNAIKLYSQHFVLPEHQEEFVKLSNEIIQEFKAEIEV